MPTVLLVSPLFLPADALRRRRRRLGPRRKAPQRSASWSLLLRPPFCRTRGMLGEKRWRACHTHAHNAHTRSTHTKHTKHTHTHTHTHTHIRTTLSTHTYALHPTLQDVFSHQHQHAITQTHTPNLSHTTILSSPSQTVAHTHTRTHLRVCYGYISDTAARSHALPPSHDTHSTPWHTTITQPHGIKHPQTHTKSTRTPILQPLTRIRSPPSHFPPPPPPTPPHPITKRSEYRQPCFIANAVSLT